MWVWSSGSRYALEIYFDANSKQMIFNATETAKIPVGQIADTKEGSSLQGKAAKKLKEWLKGGHEPKDVRGFQEKSGAWEYLSKYVYFTWVPIDSVSLKAKIFHRN